MNDENEEIMRRKKGKMMKWTESRGLREPPDELTGC
jgi:hypothetical protein